MFNVCLNTVFLYPYQQKKEKEKISLNLTGKHYFYKKKPVLGLFCNKWANFANLYKHKGCMISKNHDV